LAIDWNRQQRFVPAPRSARRATRHQPVRRFAQAFGIHVATVNDRSLFSTAVFILAARSDMPSEELRKRFSLAT